MADNKIITHEINNDFQQLINARSSLKVKIQNATDKTTGNPIETKLWHADKAASFEDFIEMVNRMISRVLGKQKVTFSPDEGSKVKIPSTETMDNPHIQFKILSRKPRGSSIKPKAMEEFVHHNDGRNGVVYSQIFDYTIQFDILSSDYVIANEVMNTFEDAMFNYTAYFKKNGISELYFMEQLTDNNLDIYRNTVSVRSLQYRVTIEKIRLVFDAGIANFSAVE